METIKNELHLTQSTIEKLGYYVYFLVDSHDKKVFYVGKGKGNRINQHLMGALDETSKESEKIKKIREIGAKGKKVELVILRHGLTETEAFEVESAMIDFIGLDNLTNIVKGHDSFDRGKMSLEHIKIRYEAKPACFDEPAMLIRINKQYRYDMSPNVLYEATRKEWVVGKRAETIHIACAVYAGIVREVYVIQKWIPAESEGRMMFEGKIAPVNVREKYINTSVAHMWKKGSQNPIKYVQPMIVPVKG